MEQEKTEEQPQNTKDLARFLLSIITFASGSLVLKMAWNLGLSSLFPNTIPQIRYIHAVTWLTMLYIVSRTIATAWIGEAERSINYFLEDLKDAAMAIKTFVNDQQKPHKQDSSDLN